MPFSSSGLGPASSRSADERCEHCGDVCSAGEAYCCAGCKAAAALLAAGGWTKFYALRGDRGGRAGTLVDEGGAIPAWFEGAIADASKDVDSKPSSVAKLTCNVQGIHCAACTWLIPELIKACCGESAIVNAGRGTLTLHFKPQHFDAAAFVEQMGTLGYALHPLEAPTPHVAQKLLVRMGLTIALAANTMILSAARYLGLSSVDGALFLVVEAVLMALAVAIGGTYFFSHAIRALRTATLSLDVPIALGIALGSTGSLLAFAAGLEATYFDSVTIFIALMLVGRALQATTAERAQALVRSPQDVAQWRLRRVVANDAAAGGGAPGDGAAIHTEVVAASDVRVGDVLWMTPGDLLLAPATALEAGSFSFEWTDGEPEPRAIEPGVSLSVGARHRGNQPLRVVVTAAFDAQAVSGLLAPRNEGTDAIGTASLLAATRLYPWVVLSLAAIGFAAWFQTDMARAVEITISLLVITCPCALGLAIPLAYELAAGRAHELGVLVRRLSVFDRLPLVDVVALDKTGTASVGELTLVDSSILDAMDDEKRSLLSVLARSSNHPRSRTIAAALDAHPPQVCITTPLRPIEIPGMGVEVRVGDEVYRIGRRSYALGADAVDDEATVFAVETDGGFRSLAAMRFDEQVRPGAESELASLAAHGVEVSLLSGDDETRVGVFAQQFGFDPARAHGSCSPAEKAAWVRRSQADGHRVWMIGDGLNDGEALDVADVRAAPALDVPAAVRACDLVSLGRSLLPASRLIDLSLRLRWVVRANVAFALVYNLVAATCALMGWVTPLFAALWMPAGSLVVVVLTRLALSSPIDAPVTQAPATSEQYA